jgi:hypothetical protein
MAGVVRGATCAPTIRVVPLRRTCYWWATCDMHGSEDPWHRSPSKDTGNEVDFIAGA